MDEMMPLLFGWAYASIALTTVGGVVWLVERKKRGQG